MIYAPGVRQLPYAVLGLVKALELRGHGHGPAIESALINQWRWRCLFALHLDREIS